MYLHAKIFQQGRGEHNPAKAVQQLKAATPYRGAGGCATNSCEMCEEAAGSESTKHFQKVLDLVSLLCIQGAKEGNGTLS